MCLCVTDLFTDTCIPKDSNECLQSSPDWGAAYNCANSVTYCSSYGKDMRRCCPDSCNTGTFTEQDCISFGGSGRCIYPNDAQCYSKGMLYLALA